MKPVKTTFEPGDVIADQYEVQRVLGKGGMGKVYLVMDRATGKRLALKTLLSQYMANSYAVKRFIREVHAIRRLSHPAIVTIHDARRTEHLLFYTMDYVKGKSLRVLMQQRGRLGLGSTIRVLALLAHALEHAHKFTVHRDLSPENVMVTDNGGIKLLDFGLAKLSDNQGAFTQIGVSLGKWQYNAPEQSASAAEVDHRADIFSMGVMFYEMLSGRLPRMGEHLSDLVPGLPKECDAFVEKAMAISPDDRFSDAREFRVALMRIYNRSLGKEDDAEIAAGGPEVADAGEVEEVGAAAAHNGAGVDKTPRQKGRTAEEAPAVAGSKADTKPEAPGSKFLEPAEVNVRTYEEAPPEIHGEAGDTPPRPTKRPGRLASLAADLSAIWRNLKDWLTGRFR